MGQIQTLDEFLGLLVRRRLVIAAVTVLGTVLALLYALSRPVIYESAAVIQVESPTVADRAGAPVASASAQRLQAIQQRLTTRENLLEMIDRHDLYATLPLTNDEKVHLMRLAVRFQTVASAAQQTYGAPPQVSALIIFAQADQPAKAARIANDFAQGVLDAGAEGQSGRAREAVSFFTEEERRVNAAIAVLEDEIAVFKAVNGDALPALRDMRRDEILGLENALREVDQALVALSNERDRIGAGRSLRETDRRQIDALGAQIDTARAQREALAAQRDALVTSMARMPEVERALGAYERRLDQLQAQFDLIATRLAEADTAMKLEDRQQAERFTLLERAVLPDYPISGGRRKLAMAGAVVSLILGVGVAFVLDLLNPVLRTAAQMERQLGLRPVVSISEMSGLRPPRGAARPARHDGASGAGAGGDMLGRIAAEAARPMLGLPRYAVFGGGAALFLMVAAVV